MTEWPPDIRGIYEQAKADLEGDAHPLDFGPAHIVWADQNWDAAQWCLDHFDKYGEGFDSEQLAIVRRSLIELLALKTA